MQHTVGTRVQLASRRAAVWRRTSRAGPCRGLGAPRGGVWRWLHLLMASAAEERNEVAARTAGAASSPEHVRCVLLNYMLHHGHLHTAAAFLRTRVPTHGSALDSAMEMDTDGVAAREAHSSTASLEADRAVLVEAGVDADQFDRIHMRRRTWRSGLRPGG